MTINEVFIASAETEQKVVEQIGDDQWELMMPEKITRTPMSLMEVAGFPSKRGHFDLADQACPRFVIAAM